jgi:EmrB/QacA subfamily drug resistance transporter
MVLAIAAVAQFMVILDVSIVNVALPSMQRDLSLSTSGLQWVVNAYTLTFAGLLLLGGRAADFFGRKKVFLVGVVLFSLASLAGGFAQDETSIIAARAVQGLGGAVLAPSTLSLLTTTYTEPHARARALGVWSAVAGAGGAMGGLIGGILTQVANWRWVLFVNVPIGAVLVAASVWALVESKGRVRSLRGLDLPGSIVVTLGLSSLVYAVVGTDTHSWGSATTLVPLVAGVVLLALFVLIEARSAEPLVPLGIFRLRALSGANLVALLIGMGMFSFWFFLSLHLQRVHGFDALQAGLAFMPASALLIAGSTVAAKLVRRIGAKPLLVVGPFLSAAGLAWLSLMSATGSYAADVLAPSSLAALGIGVTMVPLTVAATAGVPAHQAGLASGLLNTSRQVGGALGLAVLSTVAAHITAGRQDPASLSAGYDRGLLVGALIVLLGAVAALTLPASGTRRPGVAAQATTPEASAQRASTAS